MQCETFAYPLLISLLLIVSVCGTFSSCKADCTSPLTQRPPSLYELYCCETDNSGKTIKLSENNRVKIIFCPSNLPTSCQRFVRSLNNCSEIFRANISAPSGYYVIKGSSVYCDIVDYINELNFSDCYEIFQNRSFAPSGYYTIQALNGSLISVYCDMEGSNCDGKGGWMRVGYLNMSEPNATCPPGLMQQQYNNIDHGVCGLSDAHTHTFFSTQGIYYSKVCGQLRGYQYRAPDAFGINGIRSDNIDSCYVDGISITYGSIPRKHIWTYACGITSDNIPYPGFCCPCNSDNTEAPEYKPNFVGDNYYCESGIPPYVSGNTHRWQQALYVNDPLWDGQQCDGNESPCCTNPKMPWFIKTLNETTTEDIELRVCGNEGYPDEDISLDIIELYIQ